MKTWMAAVLLAAAMLGSGCAAHNLARAYSPLPALPGAPKTGLLLVEYPVENRPLKDDSKIAVGMLSMIPLVPYGHQVLAPEMYMRGRYKFGYTFGKDLQETVVKDLQASGLAEKVCAGERVMTAAGVKADAAMLVVPAFTWEGKTGPVPKGARVLALRLDEGVANRNVTMYGISIVVVPLWMLGLPTAYGDFDLKLTAQLKDDTGRVLAERAFAGKDDFIEVLYTASSAGLWAMPRAYGAVSPQLRNFLKDNM